MVYPGFGYTIAMNGESILWIDSSERTGRRLKAGLEAKEVKCTREQTRGTNSMCVRWQRYMLSKGNGSLAPLRRVGPR